MREMREILLHYLAILFDFSPEDIGFSDLNARRKILREGKGRRKGNKSAGGRVRNSPV